MKHQPAARPCAPRPATSPAAAGLQPAGLSLALSAAFTAALSAAALPVVAQPVGGQAIHGSASVTTQGNQTIVTTGNGAGTSHSAINWQSFNVPAGTLTRFDQPSAASTSINRVLGNNPSAIFGTLSSNGKLVLVNPSGIAVGAGAVVDTAGFTASALRMTDADALAGRMVFGSDSLTSGGVSVNGHVIARSGDVVLIGSNVQTGADALIQSPSGATILAAGQKVEVTGRGLEGIRMAVQAPQDQAVNLGTLKGDAVGIFANQLRHSGLIQASAATADGGKVSLKAVDSAEIDGAVRANALNGLGGQVHATANKVKLKSGAVIDVSGPNGGGEALIGGGWQGHDGRIANADRTTLEMGSTILANATEQGDGGTVVVWSDSTTRFGGHIEAKGGAQGGNGGLVETSGKQNLVFRGSVDTSASKGKAGTLLLDPQDIFIANGTGAAGDAGLGDNTIDGTDANATTDVTISENALEALSGNVLLQASRDVIFQNLSDNQLNLANIGGGSSFTISAGRNITQTADVNDRIVTNGGAVSMATTAGTINLGGIQSKGGAVTLTAGGASGNVVIREVTTTPGGGGGGNVLMLAGGFVSMNNIDARGPSFHGNVTIEASGGAIYQQTGTTLWGNDVRLAAVGGIDNGAGGPLRLDAVRLNAGNSGSGEVNLQHVGSNPILVDDIGPVGYGIRNQATAGGVRLSSTSARVDNLASITATNGNIEIVADKMSIGQSINSGGPTAGSVTLRPFNNGTVIDLGSVTDAAAGTLELCSCELSYVTSGILKIGAAGYTGGISQTTNIVVAGAQVGQVSLINDGNIERTGSELFSTAGLNLDSKANVNMAGTVSKLSGRFGGSGNFTFANSGALQVDTVDIIAGVAAYAGGTGNVNVSSTGALDVNQNVTTNAGSVTLGGAGVTVASGRSVSTSGGAITLSPTGGLITLTGSTLTSSNGNVQLNSASSVALGTVNAGTGNVSINTSGTLSQSGPLTAGPVNLSGGGTINLNNASNAINSIIGLSIPGGAITLRNNLGLNVGTVVGNGNAVDIRTNGALTVGDATGNGITLQALGAGNDLTLGGILNGGAGGSTVTAANNVVFGNGVSISNNLATSGNSQVVGSVTLNSGTWTNSGTLLFPAGPFGSIALAGGSSLNNTGAGTIQLANTGGTAFSGAGTVSNAGQLQVTGGPNSSSAVIANSGTIHVTNGGLTFNGGLTTTGTSVIDLSAGTSVTSGTGLSIVNNGLIQGLGTVTMNGGGTLTNNGFIKPGGTGAIASLTVNGNFVQSASGTTVLEVSGPTTYDVLNLTGGTASVGGTVALSGLAYTPVAGDAYNLVQAAAPISGTFSTQSLPTVGGLTIAGAVAGTQYSVTAVSAPPPPPPSPPTATIPPTASSATSVCAHSAGTRACAPAATAATAAAPTSTGASTRAARARARTAAPHQHRYRRRLRPFRRHHHRQLPLLRRRSMTLCASRKTSRTPSSTWCRVSQTGNLAGRGGAIPTPSRSPARAALPADFKPNRPFVLACIARAAI